MAYLIFGGFGVLSGILSLQLPETLGKPLPETIEDVENEASAAYTTVIKVSPEDVEGRIQQFEDKINLLAAEAQPEET